MIHLKMDVVLIMTLAVVLFRSSSAAIQSLTLTASESHSLEFHDLTVSGMKNRIRRDLRKPRINYLHIESKVSTRFAETKIESDLENLSGENAQSAFELQIPEAAFVSYFSMIIDGVTYNATVKSKEDAQTDFDNAVANNKSAGQVKSDTERTEMQRGFEYFIVAVNVKANSAVQFTIIYQELLQRRFGLYENRISIRPNQIVQDLKAEVLIYEPQGISALNVFEPLVTNSIENQDTTIEDLGEGTKRILYSPEATRQEALRAGGIVDDLVVRYDVIHDDSIGLIQRAEEYFVHFFSPDEKDLVSLSKNIVFVIDISGSMSGRKMEQTRSAMIAILDRLKIDDRFMLILFDDSLEYWPPGSELVPVNQRNIQNAKNFALEKLEARGSTNINEALIKACGSSLGFDSIRGQNMIVFLTDGNPTSGERRSSKIVTNVEGACQNEVAIFSLGFGFDLEFELLQGLAYRTRGFATRIYEGDDATNQLEEFFERISSPLIYDVSMKYPEQAVDVTTLTTNTFAQFFSGSELVVSGKVKSNAPDQWQVVVTGQTSAPYEISNLVNASSIEIPPFAQNAVTEKFMEKLYVYLTIKDLLKKLLIVDDESEKARIESQALDLSLTYQLVTPLTSMIIVEEEQVAEEDMEMADVSGTYIKTMNSAPSGKNRYSNGSTVASPSVAMLLITFAWYSLLIRNNEA